MDQAAQMAHPPRTVTRATGHTISAVPARRSGPGEGVLALFLVSLVALVVIGVALVLFSWVTSTVPSSQLMACPELGQCAPVPAGTDGAEAPVSGGLRLDEPRMAP